MRNDTGLALAEQAVLECLPQTMLVVDDDNSIVFANAESANVFGCCPRELVGLAMTELIAEPCQRPFARTLTRFVEMQPAAPLCFVSHGQRGSGEEFSMEVRMGLLRKGREQYVLIIVQDVTELDVVKEKLRRSQSLEPLALLTRGVAHDFNNVLTVINGYGELLLKNPRCDADMTSILRNMLLAGKHASKLVQLLTIFNSEHKTSFPRVLDLNEVAGSTVKFLAGLLGKNISIVSRFAPDLNCVRADSCQLERVIVNLAVNARDAMEGAGQIVVESANVPTGSAPELALPPGDYVMLAFSDNGCGMDEKTRDRIFEPLFTTKKPGSGTGLGLATVAEIIEQNGGHIRVRSAPGQGTTFKILLPRVPHVAAACETDT